MNASESRLGNDITKSYIASFAQEYSGIGLCRHGVKVRVGNEDTSPVTPTLIISGCDIWAQVTIRNEWCT
ncbi:hypothetical protein HanRHA438_Chr11g0505841 [Helianthus annuus]|nr:hypothetical protein HanRHA438_Chr11g0505841 [Helianthus annuus]